MTEKTRLLSLNRTTNGTRVMFQYRKPYGPYDDEVCLGMCVVLDAKFRHCRVADFPLDVESVGNSPYLGKLRKLNAEILDEIKQYDATLPNLYTYHMIKEYAELLDSYDPTLRDFPELALSENSKSRFEVGLLTLGFSYEVYTLLNKSNLVFAIPVAD